MAIKLVSEIFTKALSKTFPELYKDKAANIVQTQQSKFGDFTCYSAIDVYQNSPKGTFKNPQAVAELLLPTLSNNPFFKKVISTPQGYINIFLSENFLSSEVENILQNNGPSPPFVTKKRVLVDFSSPNIAKEMHVGHLRSTIIGESLCRVLEFCGHEVLRVNHIGDWGTQFGMLIAYLKDQFPDYLTSPPAIADLQSFYKLAKARFDKDQEFKERARMEVVQLQSGNSENLAAWKIICDISEKEFQRIYDRLDISLTTKGESYYNSLIPDVVAELEQKGLLTVDQGAKLLFVPGYNQPMMVVKSDGGYTYDTTDLAALRYRLQEQKAEWILYVVDAGQSSHFELLFEAAKMAGWYDPAVTRLDHVAFGLVCGDDGKKFKTRSGTTVKLSSLLDEAVSRSKQVILERNNNISEEDLEKTASVIGYGAVRYADLKIVHGTNYVFSYDRMLDLKGNTAVYLLYTYARICSILSKHAKVSDDDLPVDFEHNMALFLKEGVHIELDEASEMILARRLTTFTSVIEDVFSCMDLHNLCSYLYVLCSEFSQFHVKCRVIGHEKEKQRILLCHAVRLVIEKGLYLLGIHPLEQI